MHVAGEPRGSGAWRAAVGRAAWPLTLARADIDPTSTARLVAEGSSRRLAHPGPAQLRLDFVVTHWVDLDTLTEVTLAGLRDAGWYGRGLRGLRGLLSTKTEHGSPGVTITGAHVGKAEPPGPAALDVTAEAVPRGRPAVRAWCEDLRRAWAERPLLDDRASWIDVTLGASSRASLLGGLESVVDALEPVLGRDPRGRSEMFPNDHLVIWLRVRRGAADDPALRLRLGACADL